MVLKSSPAKPQTLTLSLIFLSLIIFLLAMIFCARPHIIFMDRTLQNQYYPIYDGFPNKIPMPRWLEFVVKETEHEKLKIAFVNMNETAEEENYGLRGTAEFIKVDFERVDENVEWKDFFPEWINESAPLTSQKCPEIPMPKFEDYTDLDVVVARIPCVVKSNNKGLKEILRLQVNLVVAKLLVNSGLTIIEDAFRDVYLVVISYCGPMLEIFRCDDLIWHERNVRIYRPNLSRLKQKVLMPVGTCSLAPAFAEPGQERWRTNINHDDQQRREAYVTVLHSSEDYVCGAIALAQSITQSGSTRDLVLLADEAITKKSLAGLKEAGWKIKPIRRIRSPHAQRNAYNKWSFSKLRIWQLTEYHKVIFIDADVILLRNIDDFFIYPQLSAVGNSRHVFNSGVMLIEPSNCTFKILMRQRFTMTSYNGGGYQGYLNQVFSWWHRWPSKLNFLKSFYNVQDLKHEIPEDLYAIHYLGIKPWMCYQDYDCNWDVSEFRRFASDMAHEKWWEVYKGMSMNLRSYCALTTEMDDRINNAREISRKASSPDDHWKIQVKDPRRNSGFFFPFWM